MAVVLFLLLRRFFGTVFLSRLLGMLRFFKLLTRLWCFYILHYFKRGVGGGGVGEGALKRSLGRGVSRRVGFQTLSQLKNSSFLYPV